MILPPELIDRILKSLRGDPESLMAAGLISKAWTGWSQTHLFESVHLKPPNLPRWLTNVPQGPDGPASHTRALTLEEYRLTPWINPQYLDFPLSNLTSFRDVRSLTLVQWNATLFHGVSPEPYFGHFGKSLRALSLRFCTLDPTTLFEFLSLLPNVQDLEIAYLFPHSATFDTIPDVPNVTPDFGGTLSLADLASGHLLLKALAALPLRFTTVSIRGCTFHEPDVYQMLFSSCQDTLVSLRFEKSYRDRPVPDVSLASCGKLEEVYALLRGTKRLPRSFLNLLSSITSGKLRTVSLSFIDFLDEEVSDSEGEYDSEGWDDSTETWESMDAILGRLAKQVSSVGGKLTLELNIRRLGSEPIKLDRHLSRFLEYGRLVVHPTQIHMRCRMKRL